MMPATTVVLQCQQWCRIYPPATLPVLWCHCLYHGAGNSLYIMTLVAASLLQFHPWHWYYGTSNDMVILMPAVASALQHLLQCQLGCQHYVGGSTAMALTCNSIGFMALAKNMLVKQRILKNVYRECAH